jgi:hypothetical protein
LTRDPEFNFHRSHPTSNGVEGDGPLTKDICKWRVCQCVRKKVNVTRWVLSLSGDPPPHLLKYSSSLSSSSYPALLYASLYPLCLTFLIFVSYIPEQIEGENKKREKIGERRIREGK